MRRRDKPLDIYKKIPLVRSYSELSTAFEDSSKITTHVPESEVQAPVRNH